MDEQTQATIPPKATPPTPPAAAPGAPRPITVRLKPIAPAPSADGSAPAATASSDVATVKLRPVTLAPSTTAPILPPSATGAITPAQVAAAVQAAKSKTSRISLDSVIGASPSIPIQQPDNAAPKTIRLKRPTDLGAPSATAPAPIIPPSVKSATAAIIPPPTIPRPAATPATMPPPAGAKPTTPPTRQTSRIPDSAIPSEPMTPAAPPAAASGESSTITQKKTLKIRRQGTSEPSVTVAAGNEAGTDASMEGVALTPISEIEAMRAPAQSKALTIVALISSIAALFVIMALNWCLAADTIKPVANKNTAASIPLDGPFDWPGKFLE